MSVHEDITDGTRCMTCHQELIGDNLRPCNAGHPLFCEYCWKKLPKCDRDEGAPYFCETTGEVSTG